MYVRMHLHFCIYTLHTDNTNMFIVLRERDLVGSVTYEGAQHVGREQLLVSGVWLSPQQVVLRVLYVYIGEFNVI